MKEKVLINFAKVNNDAIIPSKNEEDAGYDIYANFKEDYIVIEPNQTKMIPTGIASAFSNDYYFQIEERGSTGTKGIKKSAGIIDSSFRGEWFIPIVNANTKPIVICKIGFEMMFDDNFIIYPYEKAIAQAILLPVPKTEIKEISFDKLKKIPSLRGDGSLGSSGK